MYKKIEKIVITGVGAVTPLSDNLTKIEHNLRNGISGISYIQDQLFDTFPVRHAGIVSDTILEAVCTCGDDLPRTTKIAILAAQKAVLMANYRSNYATDRFGISLGSEPPAFDLSLFLPFINSFLLPGGTIDFPAIVEIQSNIQHKLPSMNYYHEPDKVLLVLSELLQANGPVNAHLETCAASAVSIIEAYEMLKNYEVDVMLAGGVSSKIEPFSIARLYRIGALAPTEDAEPALISRPFDKNRNGFTIAEGGVVFMIERLSDAIKRGATPLLEIIGYGTSVDGYSLTDPHPEAKGMILAMNRALKYANVRPEEIDYLNAHGTSTLKNDRLETMAIKSVFGKCATELSISATKSMHGHLMSAAGAMEALVCLLGIRGSFIPPTINYLVPDISCDLNYTTIKALEKKINIAMSNSFGLGGQNCSLIFKKIGMGAVV